MFQKPCTLEKSILDLKELRKEYTKIFKDVLSSIEGTIHLIIDNSFSNLFNHIFMIDSFTQILEEHGVVNMVPLKLDTQLESIQTQLEHLSHGNSYEQINIVFIVRPCISTTQLVSEVMKRFLSKFHSPKMNNAFRYYLYFSPRRDQICEEILNQNLVIESLSIGEFPVEFVPLDDDILTLSQDMCLRSCYLEGNNKPCWDVAHALISLEKQFGEIPYIKLKGNLSNTVWKQFLELKEKWHSEVNKEIWNKSVSPIETLILIDRKVDFMSALCTPLTYEGLLNECIGIRDGCIATQVSFQEEDTEDAEVHQENASEPMLQRLYMYALNSNDILFEKIRNKNIEAMGKYLNEKAQELSKKYSTFRQDGEKASISELHEFVKKVPELKEKYHSLQLHVHFTEKIKEITTSKKFHDFWILERSILEGLDMSAQIMELIYKQECLEKVLRLICLFSIVQHGIKESLLQDFRQLCCRTYGFEILLTFENLEKVGLLRIGSDPSPPMDTLRSSLRLTLEQVNVHHPNDISYVTSGYAPLSVRLIEEFVKEHSWKGIQQSLRMLLGPTIELSQKSAPLVVTGSRKVILVCFIGGITYAEIAAIRFLKATGSYDIIIATTNIMSGNSMIRSLVQEIHNGIGRCDD